MTTKEEITKLLGREPTLVRLAYKGKTGYLPEYFNFTDRNNAASVFGETEDVCLLNFLTHLKKTKGDTNGDTSDGAGHSGPKDPSTSNFGET